MKISVITPTHNPTWLIATYESLKAQTHTDWEWIVVSNNFDQDSPVPWEAWDAFIARTTHDPRVIRIDAPLFMRGRSVGAIKAFGFSRADGDVVLELDHDDLLHPEALWRCATEFTDSAVDFVYSECADFSDPPGRPITYHPPENRAAWASEGWKFGTCEIPDSLKAIDPGAFGTMLRGPLPYPITPEPSALGFALIMTAPNHFRAWRRSFYERIGGHDGSLEVCDDHELMIRTYLQGNVLKKIPEVLYFYRVNGQNTWSANIPKIRHMTEELRAKHLHALVAKECERRKLPCYDLGGAFDSPGKPWIPVDRELNGVNMANLGQFSIFTDAVKGGAILAELTRPWPFEDSSVGAFRAFDFLEHIADKRFVMSEIYRCLAPGGWLLSSTPDALDIGAHQDPTHVSYWVENSFRYYTEARLAKYIRNKDERFMAVRLFKTGGEIPYVIADLVSLKDDDGHLPGRRGI